MLRTLIFLTSYTLSLLQAKPLTNYSPTSTLPATTQGCTLDGKSYSPGERFGEGNNGRGWCYGYYCGHDGFVIAWDNFNCSISTTSMPYTTSHPTTPKGTTPKTTKGEATTPKSSTPLTTSKPPTTIPRPLGCEYQGQFYSPGESFGEGNDGKGWCYGLYCSDDGSLVPWDNFNCISSTISMPYTTSHPTTPKSTTPKTTKGEATTPKSSTPLTTSKPPTTTPRPLGCFNCHSTTSPMSNTTANFTTQKITTPSNTTPKNTILATTLLLSTVFSLLMALTSVY